MAAAFSHEELMRALNHIFLPPKLPNGEDKDSDDVLVRVTAHALKALRPLVTLPATQAAVDSAIYAISSLRTVHDNNGVSEVALRTALVNLEEGKGLAIHVSAQNAAILVTRQTHQLLFEQFELSPTNEAVFAAKGRLVRSFPGSVVIIEAATLHDADCASSIAGSIATMANQPVAAMQPQTRKAGACHYEDRNTTNPGIISELLFGMLQGIGNSTPHKGSYISKRTREEVCWADSIRPWRRSPIWLLIRVALQLTISRAMSGSHVLYKKIMCFLMSHVLDQVLQLSITVDADTLYIMNAKIDRRRQKLLKMGDSLQDPVGARVSSAVKGCNKALSTRWSKIQEDAVRHIHLAELSSLDFETDSHVHLPRLDAHIRSIQARQPSSDMNANVGADTTSSGLLVSGHGKIVLLPNSVDAFTAPNLQHFERWVARDLDGWTSNASAHTACKKICELMKSYHTLASQFYNGNPEGVSVMLLTELQLWTACDKVAARQCDLLRNYTVPIPTDALQLFVLPTGEQMWQLSEIEHYLLSREGKYDTRIMFDITSSDSFAALFFDWSPGLQELQQHIRGAARLSQRAKQLELEGIKQEYSRLTELYQQTDCGYRHEFIEKDEGAVEIVMLHDDRDCRKCKYDRSRGRLQIQVYEWPLPSNEQEEKAVLFELHVPTWFATWREAMSFLLCEVLGGRPDGATPSAAAWLSSDPHLKAHYREGARSRIGLLSENKSTLKTHYKGKALDKCELKDVCLKNGFKYRYSDSISGCYIGNYDFGDELALSCTYSLPRESKKVQRFLMRTAIAPDGRPPNLVISSPRDCPPHMTLEEYQELCTLPLGRHIQWVNIILQLVMPGVDLKKLEATLTIMQCVNQCGPPSLDGRICRQSHIILSDRTRVLWILNNLQTALQRVQENWESVQAVGCFVAVALRVLSLSGTAQNAYLSFLKDARTVVAGWLQVLRRKAHEARSTEDRTIFATKCLELALVCTLTFDLDDGLLSDVLQSPADASLLIIASIVLQEGDHSHTARRPAHIAVQYLRFQRLMHRSYRLLAMNGAAVDLAVKEAWSGYIPGPDGWSQSTTADYWISSTTSPSGGRMNALRQLPAHYLEHTLYKALFAEAILEVIPSSSPGFEFSTKQLFDGHMVRLGIAGGDLLVQATKDGTSYEIVPIDSIQSVFPDHYLNDYVLWYSCDSDLAQLRPLDDPWNPESPQNWILTRDPSGTPWRASKEGTHLLGINSRSAKAVSHILQPLAMSSRIHCLRQTNGSLLVDIPSLRLGFTLARKSSMLQSREYRTMMVDENQTLSTLIGFSSKLLLRSEHGEGRLVLLLRSNLTYWKSRDHVHVQADETSAIAEVHAIEVDDLLLRLQDNGDLGCKLYMAYLHALTSFCLADPFTLRTGTEQALMILTSKAVESFDQLSQSKVNQLCDIAALSPRRSFYPDHKRVMERVEWDDQLGFLAQHEGLAAASNRVLQICCSAQIYCLENKLQMPSVNVENFLSERHSIRASGFRVNGFGAENHTKDHDLTYSARDRSSTKSQAIARLCTHFCRDGDALYRKPPTLQRLCDLMQTVDLIHGPHVSVEYSSLQYDGTLIHGGLRRALSKLPSLHQLARSPTATSRRKYAIMLWLSALAFADDADFVVLQLVATLFKSPNVASVGLPPVTTCTPRDGWEIDETLVRASVDKYVRKFEDCPEYRLPPRSKDEPWRIHYDSRFSAWRRSKNEATELVTNWFVAQGSCQKPRRPTLASAATYLRLTDLMSYMTAQFKSWDDNNELREYIIRVIEAMKPLEMEPVVLAVNELNNLTTESSYSCFLTDDDLFSVPPPFFQDLQCSVRLNLRAQRTTIVPTAAMGVESLISRMRSAAGRSVYENEYLSDLEDSLRALRDQRGVDAPEIDFTLLSFQSHLAVRTAHLEHVYNLLIKAIDATPGLSIAKEAQQSPRVSPTLLLQQLTRYRWPRLSQSWQRCVTEYALSLTAVQRAKRLCKLASSMTRTDDFLHELLNAGHENWDPMHFPESLLIEVESGILIRERQELIAQEMRNPTTGLNSIMQLNMGEGKSSVIVPIVATTLANGSQLLRVVVGKPQSKQMAQMLISKLGGIVGRRVYHMPFSRSVSLDSPAAQNLHNMLQECMETGGVLLVQPEHILSFKLMVLECFIRRKQGLGGLVSAAQDFLEHYARDIVDESDENFSTKFELIYTMGGRRSVELTPHRWLIMQELLDLVRQVALTVAKECVGSVDIAVTSINGCFPRTRLLRPEAGELLVAEIAEHICKHGLHAFQIGRLSASGRTIVATYITKAKLSEDEMQAMENSPLWNDDTRSQLLLLRGLLADGILVFALARKRYRVDFGRATRTPPTRLAVPYRAKDNPTPRSEFSHPDVVIALTALCYYYEGLSDEELFVSFEHLMNSDQANVQYQQWIQDAHQLNFAFHQLSGINLRDRPQCVERLFPSLRYGKSVIDYYLAHYVYPQEMREYPHKLSASGWDIGKQRARLTTGFSGTIDSRKLLPVGAEYLDLRTQKHTNALVLDNLLQKDNSVHLMPPVPAATTDADHLLSVVLQLEPAVKVILDVGAQVLELNNLEIAQAWLEKALGHHEAVIFVDDDDEICVVDRKGRVEHLQRSSYQGRMEKCLVFLDEAHTRGIDLKLPADYRAAVTLGTDLTKDRLVQACMRLRKLGKGQSVVFCISEEIQAKILKVTQKAAPREIEVLDVLAWSISETHSETRRNMPLWAAQGERFVRHEKLWKAVQNSQGETALTRTQASKFLEDEGQTLDQRYQPRRTKNQPAYLLAASDPDLQHIADRCQAFDGLEFTSGPLSEEQERERELAPEVEAERQVPRPPPANPAQHKLHPDVEQFAITGEQVTGSKAYSLVFPTVKETTAGRAFGLSMLKSGRQLLATVDFATTVEKTGGQLQLDPFLRPVQWLLVGFVQDTDVVETIMCVSPWEANQLFGRMSTSTATSLCVYKARINSGYTPIDKLDFFNISARANPPILPRSLAAQLNLFAGQLYISSYQDYEQICKYLGIASQEWSSEMEGKGWKIGPDGYVLSDDKGRKGPGTKLTRTSAPFFKRFFSIRRHGEGVSKTDMGRLLDGKLFRPSDFDA